MLTINDSFYELKKKLIPLYDEREAVAIAHEFVDHITGLTKTQRLLNKHILLTEQQYTAYEAGVAALLQQRPLQYVTGSAWFMGREYTVNEHVLIPRPETEELVAWIADEATGKPTILDIGTGSGCIPTTLKLALPQASITAIDISQDALHLAQRNAAALQAEVSFEKMDILDPQQWSRAATYDIIVSNPPYIPQGERENMHSNVKDHEPELALFVPDDDALLFYRAIADFGQTHLAAGGSIYCELEQNHAIATQDLFISKGYSHTSLRKDMHGNWRMLKAKKG